METERKFVIGIDYGTDSCRAILVDALSGVELASAASPYQRWNAGLYCNPSANQYRQHPLDYIESLEAAVGKLFSQHPDIDKYQVVAIGIDTTGSTPVLLDENGTPLSLLPAFADNPNAMFFLWKDHTAIREADEINEAARRNQIDYTSYSGGTYSSEWVWSKMLYALRVDREVREKACSWVEHCDWMPALLTGRTKPTDIIRSRCAAGHKAMWHRSWGGLPTFDFLKSIDPLLGVFEGHLYEHTHTSDYPVGRLTADWAARLGLTTNVVVCAGALDCHMGAVGAQVTAGSFVSIVGTSTCDIMVSAYEDIGDRLIGGICGQVDGSVLPGMIGLEAGQSAFGDIYAWFKSVIFEPVNELLEASEHVDQATKQRLQDEINEQLLPYLNQKAETIPFIERLPIGLDWMNGRRTPIANQSLRGGIMGLTLASTAQLIFRSLVEATAFGAKAIVDHILSQDITIDRVIAIGGIPQKSPFVMQTLADVLGVPIKVAKPEQACALGGAMFAAVAAGIYECVELAQEAMGQGFIVDYKPDMDRYGIYQQRYGGYVRLGVFAEQMERPHARPHERHAQHDTQ